MGIDYYREIILTILYLIVMLLQKYIIKLKYPTGVNPLSFDNCKLVGINVLKQFLHGVVGIKKIAQLPLNDFSIQTLKFC